MADVSQVDQQDASSRPAQEGAFNGPRPMSPSTEGMKLEDEHPNSNDQHYLQVPQGDQEYSDVSSAGLDSSEESSDEDASDGSSKGKSANSTVDTSNYPKDSIFSKTPASQLSISNSHFRTKAKVSKQDGRLKVSIREFANRGYIARTLGAGIRNHLREETHHAEREKQRHHERHHATNALELYSQRLRKRPVPQLNIVIMVIGSRGDIQPFIKIGQLLKDHHGHRVRLATHPAFKEFIEKDCGLEFFSIGGNPSELMAFMVKNPGLIPSLETVKQGEIGKRRESMAQMFEGFWRACILPFDDSHKDEDSDAGSAPTFRQADNVLKACIEHTETPFVADAIIANPPSFAHVHCAERLGCPLHIIFTFPYTPTQYFPHPLANIKAGNVDHNYTNFMSYPLVDIMTWQGLGDLVNRFRIDTLKLDPVSTIWAPCQLYRLKTPYTYLWSPSLVPKPDDWGPEIHIAGFVFLDAPTSFQPPEDLKNFLDAGDAPVYIGFGSIVVDDAASFTKLIFEGVQKAGVRAVVNKGWGGIGDEGNTPENIFMLDNIPHDWLFPRCSAVVHHGGAGTTAIGLKGAKPTMIVPFFGDQPFWGSMVAEAKAGAHECIPYKQLTADKLAEGIKQCLSDDSQRNVQKIADSIAKEGDGAANAIRYFHDSLPLAGPNSMRCSILDDHVAVWRIRKSNLRLSALAAELLVRKGKISYDKLDLLRIYEWTDFQGPGGPITGVTSAIFRTAAGFGKGLGEGPLLMTRDIRKRARYEKKKRERARAQRSNAPSSTASESTPPPLRPTRVSTLSKYRPKNPIHTDILHAAGATLTAPIAVIARAPIELLLGLSLGLHNAPRLYGDATVRKPLPVTSLRTGLRAGATAFALDTADAVTGLVKLPVHGARQRGARGFATGVGKGVGGLVLKGGAAVVEPVAFAVKGVQKEFVRSPMGRVRAARMEQGYRGAESLKEGAEEWEKVEKGWAVMVELWKEGEKLKRQSGIIGGRIKWEREKRMWAKYGAFESVEVSEMALEARKKGVTFGEFMDGWRKDIVKGQGGDITTSEEQ